MFSGGGGVRQVCDDGPAGGGGPAHAGTSTESERDAMKSFVEFRGLFCSRVSGYRQACLNRSMHFNDPTGEFEYYVGV